MDILNQAMLFLLDSLNTLLGSYGWAIVALTVLIRLVLWPLNTAQAQSMKAMQQLQPRMKELQEKYKNDPQRMQQELMKFYSETKFNPLAGCLPMLIQLPIFIGLYGALMSPDFSMRAGNESFLIIDKLQHTLHSYGGEALDGAFNVNPSDRFTSPGPMTVYLSGRPEPLKVALRDLRMNDPNKLLAVEPTPLIPGEPARLMIFQSDLGYSDDYMKRVTALSLPVTNTKTHELEKVRLEPTAKGNAFAATVPTLPIKDTFNWDVLALIVLYGLLTFGYQKTMEQLSGQTKPTGMQGIMTQWMPLLFTAMMLIIPIPAGVFLYLLVTMLMMMVQNMVIFQQDKRRAATVTATSSSNASAVPPPSGQVINIKPDKA